MLRCQGRQGDAVVEVCEGEGLYWVRLPDQGVLSNDELKRVVQWKEQSYTDMKTAKGVALTFARSLNYSSVDWAEFTAADSVERVYGE